MCPGVRRESSWVCGFYTVAADAGAVISTRGRHKIHRALQLRGQILLRYARGSCAQLTFHLATRGLHGGQLRAGRTIQQIFRVQESSISQFARRIVAAQKLAVVEPIQRRGLRVAGLCVERQTALIRLRCRGGITIPGLQIRAVGERQAFQFRVTGLLRLRDRGVIARERRSRPIDARFIIRQLNGPGEDLCTAESRSVRRDLRIRGGVLQK